MCNVDSEFSQYVVDALVDLRLSPTDDQLRKLLGHYNAMIEANRSFNLTRITDPKEAAIKHYADSLALLLWADEAGAKIDPVLDIGTGAGFPAFPLAVLRPEWSVTAIDATRKKIDFVTRTAASLGVKNLRCEHAHSEHWQGPCDGDRTSANTYQLVVFRALSKPSKAIEQAGRFVAPGGYLVAYQSDSVDPAEQHNAEQAAAKLRLQIRQRYSYDLKISGEHVKRVLQVYRMDPEQ